MSYTRKDLKKLLKENGVSTTADNKMTLMILALKKTI